jgi:hypothetical protein
MTRWKILPAFVLTLVASLAGCTTLALFSNEIAVPYSTLTERMQARFPVERSLGGLLEVRLIRPRVSHTGTAAEALGPTTPVIAEERAKRIQISLDIEVKLPNLGSGGGAKTLYGQMVLSGVPRFDATSRSLFFSAASIERVRVDNMPDQLSGLLASAATQFVREYFADRAIYTLSAEQQNRFGSRLDRLRIEVRPDKLVFLP